LCGVDNLDSKLLGITASCISSPSFISLIDVYVNAKILLWKTAKTVPIPKDKKCVFSESNSRPISIIPVLSKNHGKMSTALIKMTDGSEPLTIL